MATPAQRDLLPAGEAARATILASGRNSLRYGVFGELDTTADTLQRIVEAVPAAVAGAMPAHAFVFVPLAIGETAHARDTEIARVHTADFADRAICHRTVPIEGDTFTFISTRLMQDRFALAFELFINVGHQFVDALTAAKTPLPERFTALLWSQARADVRGETSQDAYEARKRAIERAPGDPTASLLSSPSNATSTYTANSTAKDDPAKPEASQSREAAEPALPKTAAEHRTRYFEAAFADSLAIYMLSLAIDLDYADLREREYPLLAVPALADRLRLIAELYPPPPGYEFAIRYRRRH
ncbi:hypothetical protein [Acidipila sp. EB88]|uniref:hypothetical protein n=1 Tax=Acidipila sp. EB88 TaxID=2305226 RepID=UPI000F5D677E|nr:hypothetical protein [Acidipila sp. EB88]RRA48209.1 hypothetical protein D1Y84_07835 [Acidipila sp. EB88]